MTMHDSPGTDRVRTPSEGVFFADGLVTLYCGSADQVLAGMPAGSVDCIVTSPPYYGLRDYQIEGQTGIEPTPAGYIEALAVVFAQARRVLADHGTLWLVLGDSYSTKKRGSDNGWESSRLSNPARVQKMQSAAMRQGRVVCFDRKAKNLLGMPWRVAFALQDQGWILRNEIVWAKSNPMPESVTDRLSCSHEKVFLFSKANRYHFNKSAVGRNPGDVWVIPTVPFAGAHFAVFPPELPRRAIAAGCRPGGVVLDMFSGSGTTGLAAAELGHRYVGVDLNPAYLELSLRTRLEQPSLTAQANAAILNEYDNKKGA